MPIVQKSGGRNILIKDGKVIVNGQVLSPEEAQRLTQEGLAKLKQGMKATKVTPAKGDSVVVVNARGVHIFEKGVTIRRKY